ncbi:hypothetical protein [Virgibacillus sp. Bac332]|uniref:hypothetical protein n=1 Tax=Virgibacillus sp. Bac332 TaxID=2419842 RepID=UPI000EF51419|nr:hypothetical protein [Virgibacillus sp. Bac332]
MEDERTEIVLTSEEYRHLIKQIERVPELEESEKWLVKIREMICDEDYSPGVLEYAAACPEGVHDMVKELYDYFQKLEEQLYESEESTYQIQIQFLEKNHDYNQAEKEKQCLEERVQELEKCKEFFRRNLVKAKVDEIVSRSENQRYEQITKDLRKLCDDYRNGFVGEITDSFLVDRIIETLKGEANG